MGSQLRCYICNSTSNSAKLYSLPENIQTRNRWFTILRLSSSHNLQAVRVCSRHFSKTQFCKDGTLKRRAFPDILLNEYQGSASGLLDVKDEHFKNLKRCLETCERDVLSLVSSTQSISVCEKDSYYKDDDDYAKCVKKHSTCEVPKVFSVSSSNSNVNLAQGIRKSNPTMCKVSKALKTVKTLFERKRSSKMSCRQSYSTTPSDVDTADSNTDIMGVGRNNKDNDNLQSGDHFQFKCENVLFNTTPMKIETITKIEEEEEGLSQNSEIEELPRPPPRVDFEETESSIVNSRRSSEDDRLNFPSFCQIFLNSFMNPHNPPQPSAPYGGQCPRQKLTTITTTPAPQQFRPFARDEPFERGSSLFNFMDFPQDPTLMPLNSQVPEFNFDFHSESADGCDTQNTSAPAIIGQQDKASMAQPNSCCINTSTSAHETLDNNKSADAGTNTLQISDAYTTTEELCETTSVNTDNIDDRMHIDAVPTNQSLLIHGLQNLCIMSTIREYNASLEQRVNSLDVSNRALVRKITNLRSTIARMNKRKSAKARKRKPKPKPRRAFLNKRKGG